MVSERCFIKTTDDNNISKVLWTILISARILLFSFPLDFESQ